MNIRESIGLNPVDVRNTSYPEYKPDSIRVIDPDLVFGVELEIEGVPHWPDLEISGMGSTSDGSLRNNGREFLLRPQKYADAVATLTKFFSNAKLSNETNYSERCSIHVHSNCQDLTFDQLQVILLLYQVTERLLFNWIGFGRSQNIFCVPWYDTNLTHSLFDGRKNVDKYSNWMKYSALNLAPLYTYGTIEWRHMHGHCDSERLFQWMRIISCFFRYARKAELKEVKEFFTSLNTNSHYNRFVESIFQEEMGFIYEQPLWEQALEEGVLLMKYALAAPAEKTTKSKAIKFAYADFQNPVGLNVPADLGIIDDVPEVQANPEQRGVLREQIEALRQADRARREQEMIMNAMNALAPARPAPRDPWGVAPQARPVNPRQRNPR